MDILTLGSALDQFLDRVSSQALVENYAKLVESLVNLEKAKDESSRAAVRAVHSELERRLEIAGAILWSPRLRPALVSLGVDKGVGLSGVQALRSAMGGQIAEGNRSRPHEAA